MAFMKVANLLKKFDTLTAVDNVSFEVEKGELLTLLGPSGCGKTTTLRLIAGLEYSDQGEIHIGDTLVQSSEKSIFVEPDKRGFGMVFQSYAIWPHMTVFANVAYPLVERKLSKTEIKERVQQVLEKVKLAGFENRSATKLSGGQQQRVALARALIYNPEVLLFDEPLSNLDAKLRIEMRNEIRQLQKTFGITSIYVTHDQEEAFALSDRIIVMKDGRIEQIGNQSSLYFQPKTRFVSQFIGQTNLIEGIVNRIERETIQVHSLGTSIEITTQEECKTGDTVYLSIRPEYIELNPEDLMQNMFQGTVEQKQYLGPYGRFYVFVQGVSILVEEHGLTEKRINTLPSEGGAVSLGFNSKECILVK